MDDDRDITAAIQKPETLELAFNALVKKYQRPLYSHLRRMLGNHNDADDALQNTFIKVWRALQSFRGDAALYTWLYRIATNEALAMIRSRKPHSELNPANLNTESTFTPPAASIEARLEQALETLPPRQRQVFLLRYCDEMSYEHMAEITGLSTGALKASYFHAAKKIEAHLTTHL